MPQNLHMVIFEKIRSFLNKNRADQVNAIKATIRQAYRFGIRKINTRHVQKFTRTHLTATRPLTLPYRDVPIFINNFNRLACLRQLIDWLNTHGYRRVFVIDNASSYPPLLSYYESLEKTGVTVIRLGKNAGPFSLWSHNILKMTSVTSEFVYTDSDVVPSSCCPGTVVQQFQALLNAYPDVLKVGLGLRLDTIPEHYEFRAEALRWEAQFWRNPAARGLMFGPVDTTFALYRPNGKHALEDHNLRTTYPYLGEHLGWYVNSADPNEEDRFYSETARKGDTSWNAQDLSVVVARGLNDVPDLRLMHLGCGKDVFPGWLNVDLGLESGDWTRAVDLDSVGNSFDDLADNSFDGFYGCHVFEHLNNSLKLMDRLHRLAKPNARMVLRVPYGSSNDAFEDPTHCRRLFEGSFVYYGQPAYSRADYGYAGDWAIERVNLVLQRDIFSLSPAARWRELRCSRNTVREMIVHLRAVKPPRPCDNALLEWPTPNFSLLDLDYNSDFGRAL